MRLTTTISLLLCFATLTQAQTLLIDYDYLNARNTRWRFENGPDTMYHQERIIRVRRETPVKIQLLNVNTEAIQSELVVRRGSNSDSLIISTLLGLIGAYAAPVGVDLKALLAMKSRGANTVAALEYAPMQVDLETARSFANAPVADIDASIRERLAEIAKWRTVREHVRALRYTTGQSKETLLKNCRENLAQLTKSAPALFDNDAQARVLLGQLATENAEYLRYALAQMEQKTSAPAAVARGDGSTVDFNQFMVAAAIRQHRKLITDDMADQLAALLLETLNHYQALSRNTFTASLNTAIDRRSEALILQFFDTTPVGNSTDKRKMIRTEKFMLSPPGQWQVNTSIGLSFIQFRNQLLSYGVVDQKIVATKLDQFIPTLAGFVQAFPGGRVGVHLGVGVPLSETKGVCFLAGPSVAFGRQKTVVFNAGFFTAKATRLGAGLSVGDKYTSTTALPTINRYEWGIQIGLSFSFGLRR